MTSTILLSSVAKISDWQVGFAKTVLLWRFKMQVPYLTILNFSSCCQRIINKACAAVNYLSSVGCSLSSIFVSGQQFGHRQH